LRATNATKDRFFNIIAHDLKNPFNAIIGFASLLTDEWNDFDDDDKIAMISSIKSSSEGAYELLMNLLEWSRLQVGKINFEPEFIDYESLIRLNFSLLRTAAEKKNIKLVSTGLCDKMVWADPNMIKTVIRNLLTNAIKFTPANGTITINCHKNHDYPGMILISIQDNGIGMSHAEIKTLFSLNDSQSKTGTDGETGTGLGLILCKEFVEKNKGKIWVESEHGKGSTFFIALPVRPN
jgi:signal transduction histidine kinase